MQEHPLLDARMCACRWTRLLLLQQLLVEAIEVLDPIYVRVPAQRRLALAPVATAPLPNLDAYKQRLVALSALEPYPASIQQHQQGQQQQGQQGQGSSGTGSGGPGWLGTGAAGGNGYSESIRAHGQLG